MPSQPPSAEALHATFDAATDFTVGIEEELLLLDPETLELVPRAPEVLGWMGEDRRFKFELPASQIEIVTDPCVSASEAAARLMIARRDLAKGTDGRVLPAGAGVSPLGAGSGALIESPRYERTVRDYSPIISWQLVCALQVHVAVRGFARALAVYNHVRSYLPWLAALAANGAFYQGRDTGLASVRPMISDLLPRQGVPPPIESWEEYARALSWGARTGAMHTPGTWWWELRPHPAFGTLEFRVPDSQSTVGEAAAIAAVIHALVVWLARRYDGGEPLGAAATWRLEENRWSACRYGVEGEMLDPQTGQRTSTRRCLEWLLETVADIAAEFGSTHELHRAAAVLEANGAIGQRRAAANGGASGVARWLVDRFLEPWPG
jgi:carboxylate-amine ligase